MDTFLVISRHLFWDSLPRHISQYIVAVYSLGFVALCGMCLVPWPFLSKGLVLTLTPDLI
jgi:hypothetical protein